MSSDVKEKKAFRPIFVVGAPRSGTTMLAVLLDRHSRIAMPPETQFFTESLPGMKKGMKKGMRREQMIDLALSNRRIVDLNLDRADLEGRFGKYPSDPSYLFRSILEAYSCARKKERPGEKSPKHLEHVPRILELYPDAKVICIIRDGRDVVRSLMNVSWAEPGNPRRLGLFCSEWIDLACLAMGYSRAYPKDRFRIVRYEDLLEEPMRELTRLCEFLGEAFEPGQLDLEVKSAVVPGWEGDWKGKSAQGLDPKRIEAWRRSGDKEQLWFMNCLMGAVLARLGYRDTGLAACPFLTRLRLLAVRIPYLKAVRPLSLFGLRALRLCRRGV